MADAAVAHSRVIDVRADGSADGGTTDDGTTDDGTTDDGTTDDGSVGDALLQLLRVMERTGAQLRSRRQDDLDKAAFLLLVHVVHDGPLRSRALAEATLADPSTVSRHVALLVERGLVERRADPDDGRATLLAATPAGVELAVELRARRNASIAACLADWIPQDRELLRTLLVRFTRDLERTRPALLAQCDVEARRAQHSQHARHTHQAQHSQHAQHAQHDDGGDR